MTRVLLNSSGFDDMVIRSPYYAGIIFGSLIMVAYSWLTRLVHCELDLCSVVCYQHALIVTLATQHHPFIHLSFTLAFGLCAYNFVRSITLDAGTCPKPSSDGELRAVCVAAIYVAT